MFLHFSIKELNETLLGPKFLITFLTSLVMTLISVYTGYRLYEEEQNWHANAISQNVQRMENLGSYGSMHTQGTKALRAPVRMSIFARGVDSAVGRSAMVNTDSNTVLRDSRIGLNPIFAVFGDLDLAFIVKIILSLFALLYSYNAISGERETGTLKLVFANAISRTQFIVGKSIGGILTILLTFFIPFLIALLMLMLVFNVTFTGGEWARICLLCLSFSLYIVVFYLIGMAMSALTRSSMLSFLLCLFVWVLSVAVLPRVAVEVANQVSPAPSVDEVEAQRAALQRTYYGEFQTRWKNRLEELFSNGNEPTEEEARMARMATEAESRAVIEDEEKRIISEYRRKQLRLLHTAEAFARVSPTSAVTFAANRIGLTDAEMRERYLRAVERYKEYFDRFAEEKKKANPKLASGGVRTSISVTDNDEGGNPQVQIDVRTPSERISVDGLPRFDLDQENFEESFTAVIPDLMVLGFQAILFFTIAFAAFLRYDVR